MSEATGQPDRARRDLAQPDHVQPDMAQPDRVQPDRVQPDRVQPDRVQPDRVQPDMAQPDHVQPDMALPVRVQPDLAQPDQGRPVAEATETHPQLEKLIAVLAQLRAPGGCAWDADQTHESLVRYLLEETYELIDAIESGDRDEMIEELGDVLYQVIFHADIAANAASENFTIEDVAAHMTAKMVGRHPHVFGSATANTAEDVVAVWDDLKRVEKPSRTSILDGVPQAMPALALADKLLGKAQKIDVRARVTSEVEELEIDSEHQLGELLLGIVSVARDNGMDAERALRSALRNLQDDVRAAEAASTS